MRTTNTGELSAIYHDFAWIRKRRISLNPAVFLHYILVSDSDYSVKLFATRAINECKQVHNCPHSRPS